MYRATTPIHTFRFTVNAQSLFKTILITYAQNDTVVLEKDKDDLTFTTTTENNVTVYEASYRLTQEETKLFNSCSDVRVQVRALTNDDEAMASIETTFSVHNVLNDEVLT